MALALLLLLAGLPAGPGNRDPVTAWPDAEPQQSRTGPTAPAEVLEADARKASGPSLSAAAQRTLPVPAYYWRHGCGPTTLGMIAGYYDGLGFELISGSAATQTDAVNQAIASGGDADHLFQPGSERSYEDYACPEDKYPNLLPDGYIAGGRTPHADDSIADFMDTSRSSRKNYYGWSWSSDVAPAFADFVRLRAPHLRVTVRFLPIRSLTWETVVAEIDAGRPMVFLVDTTGDGYTDHFVTVIGVRETPAREYGMWDTWNAEEVRWEAFAPINGGVHWGVWGAWTFEVAPAETATPTIPPTATRTLTPDASSTPTLMPSATATAAARPFYLPLILWEYPEPQPTATGSRTVTPASPPPASPTVTATASRTPTLTATIVPSNSPTVTPTRALGPHSVFGRVTLHNTPLPAAPLSLLRWSAETPEPVELNVSDASGGYLFAGLQELGTGESYFVHFANAGGDPRYLAYWTGRQVEDFGGFAEAWGGDFDLSDAQLVSPQDGATVTLPFTLRWQRRGIPYDDYGVVLFDPDGSAIWRLDGLGATDHFDVTQLPPDLVLGKAYGWLVRISDGLGGYGESLRFRTFRVRAAGG
jgi:hypothetical protein